jgi:SAM-dependent methyltransferase
MTYAYTRFLAAKKSVDDRALNRSVLDEFRRLVPPGEPRILEIGAGLGTMVARLLDWQVVTAGEYTLLDVDRRLLSDSRAWLCDWAGARGVPTRAMPDGVQLGDLRVRLLEAELGDHLEAGSGERADLLIANAVLDLVDVPAVLPGLLRLLVPGGGYWFTVNFDGESIFQPDHPDDDAVLGAYHRTMDSRVRYGRPAGESRTGRHLFGALRAAGAPPLAAGSSDWVVLAGPDGRYPDDEEHFVGAILQTIEDALDGPDAPAGLAGWLADRRRQLAGGELVYLAHQLDVAGRWPGSPADEPVPAPGEPSGPRMRAPG